MSDDVGSAAAPHSGDDVGAQFDAAREAAMRIRPMTAAPLVGGAEGHPQPHPQPWRVAKSLLVLRDQIDAIAKDRDRASDGTIGDLRHQGEQSDHNPWVKDGGEGVVTALDITQDAAGGCDCGKLTAALLASRDRRIKYVIWERRIFSATVEPWVWRAYAGSDPHTGHMHVSVVSDKAGYDDTGPWSL